jgi:hypothetical protein
LANVKDIKKRNLPNEPVPDEHGMKDPWRIRVLQDTLAREAVSPWLSMHRLQRSTSSVLKVPDSFGDLVRFRVWPWKNVCGYIHFCMCLQLQNSFQIIWTLAQRTPAFTRNHPWTSGWMSLLAGCLLCLLPKDCQSCLLLLPKLRVHFIPHSSNYSQNSNLTDDTNNQSIWSACFVPNVFSNLVSTPC